MSGNVSVQPVQRYRWSPDRGDGTYANPVLFADYSDPDVIRDGDDYYLVASSFTCTPGLPILHSRDLVNWTIVNHAVRNLPDPRGVYDTVQHGCGMWAPAIRKHAGKFWIFFPMPDEGIYVTTADDPRGRWSEPHCVQEGKGLIDPCPLWDDEGKAYLVHAYARSRAGIKNKLRVRPMAPDGSKLLGEGEIVFEDAENHPTLEGPKFHKREGRYILSAPAGGVKTGWQLILRSDNVYGPYEPKVVLEQGSTSINGPHQGAIVDDVAGASWFVHFQDRGVYGRIVHVQPVRWEDGWPMMGSDLDSNGVGEPVLVHRKPGANGKVDVATPQTSDEFDGRQLGLQWQWYANHKSDWATLGARPGHLRLNAVPSTVELGSVPNLLLQKWPAREFAVETKVGVSGTGDVQAGLIVTGEAHAAVMVATGPEHPQLVWIRNNEVVASQPLRSPAGRLRVEVTDGGVCAFSYAEPDDEFQSIGEPFQAKPGRWIGAKVGIFCRSGEGAKGHADFDHFRFAPPMLEKH